MTLKPKTQKAVRTGLWLLLDAVLINLAMILSQVLRYTTTISYSFFQIYFRIAPAMTLMGLILFAVFGLYRTMWQYASAEDLLRVVLSTLALAVCTYLYSVIANYFVRPQNLFRLHRLIYPLFWLISMALVGASRLIYRYAVTRRHFPFFPRRTAGQRRTMIVGAGWLGANVVHEMQHGNYGSCVPVIVVDDDQQRTGSSLSGVPVVRGSGNILKLASDYSIDDIIIAIATPKSDLTELMHTCVDTGCHVRRYTVMQEMNGGQGQMRDINIADLLGRDEKHLDMSEVEQVIAGRRVLVTGGGGSIGSEMCRQMMAFIPEKLVLYDISENYMYDLFAELKNKYGEIVKNTVVLRVGSIRDEATLNQVFDEFKPEIVIHAAAHKHVPLMEDSPNEAIKNNVLGTQNVADCADKFGTKRFILISTDKAVNPTNIMGASKRMCEMVIQAKNKTSKTEYAAVRFGNVLGSNGSVVPLFKKQIKEGGPVTVTHKDITRFFMTIPEAVGLVLQAMTYAKGGEVFVLDMGEPVKIYDLAVSLIKLSGLQPDIDIPIEITGLRPGEKLYEELLMSEEGLEHTKHNKIFVAEPLDIPAEEVNKRVEMLREFVQTENHTMEEIKKVVKKAVPTFVEAEEKNKKIINYKQELEKIEARQMQEHELMPKEA